MTNETQDKKTLRKEKRLEKQRKSAAKAAKHGKKNGDANGAATVGSNEPTATGNDVAASSTEVQHRVRHVTVEEADDD
jgi:hypothetical protein